MIKLKIEVETECHVLQRKMAIEILEDLTRRIKDGQSGDKVLDVNGNTVGTWSLEITYEE